jgi:hypothetical protein
LADKDPSSQLHVNTDARICGQTTYFSNDLLSKLTQTMMFRFVCRRITDVIVSSVAQGNVPVALIIVPPDQ